MVTHETKLRHRLHHHVKRVTSHKKNIGIILLFPVVLLALFFVTRGIAPADSELAFSEHSVLGVGAGSVVPASCASDPHVPGECLSASLAVSPTSVPFGGTYNTLTLTSSGASSCTLYLRYPPNLTWSNMGGVAVNGTWGPSVALYKSISYYASCLDVLGGTVNTNIVTVDVAPDVKLQTTSQGAGYPWATINSFTASTYSVPDYGSVTLTWNASGACTGSGMTAWNGPKASANSQTIINPTNYSTTKPSTTYALTLTCTVGATTASVPLYVSFSNEYDPYSCFIAGTNVRMGDRSKKAIEHVVSGDVVMSSGGPEKVLKVRRTPFEGLMYAFNGSGNYFVTGAHPFMTTGGWKSFEPHKTNIISPELHATMLEVGDEIIREDGSTLRISSIESKFTETVVHNLEVGGTHDYYADGFWVHNKMLP